MSKNIRNDNEVIQALWTIAKYCEAGDCAGCVLNGRCPRIGDFIPIKWEDEECIPVCRFENSPIDERKSDEGIISLIEGLERQIDIINGCLDSHVECIGDLRKSCDDLEKRMDNNAVWRKDVEITQAGLDLRIDELEKWRRG